MLAVQGKQTPHHHVAQPKRQKAEHQLGQSATSWPKRTQAQSIHALVGALCCARRDPQYCYNTTWNLTPATCCRDVVVLLAPSCASMRAHPNLNQGPADLRSAAPATELCTPVKQDGRLPESTQKCISKCFLGHHCASCGANPRPLPTPPQTLTWHHWAQSRGCPLVVWAR